MLGHDRDDPEPAPRAAGRGAPARSSRSPGAWSARWEQLARAAGLDPCEPVLLALSGGADSVYLLHLLAAADPAPARVLAVHVAHALRGPESTGDLDFCRQLCAELAVDLHVVPRPLDPGAPSLEERARNARYAALFEIAESARIATILTGHHADDALETLLLRLVRGSDLPALGGLPVRTVWHATAQRGELLVARPLFALRREEVRRLLRDAGLAWREDSSNADPRFARNRIRHELLPWIERLAGPGALARLQAFSQAVEGLEDELAHVTAHIAWQRLPESTDPRAAQLARGALQGLAAPLLRRALYRLLLEGTSRAPSRAVLDLVLRDLTSGRCGRHALAGRWSLQLRSDALWLLPPARGQEAWPSGEIESSAQLLLPFLADHAERSAAPCARTTGGPAPAEGRPLPLPGTLALPDGRRLTAEIVLSPLGAPIPTDPQAVELDLEGLDEPLWVRWSRPGDRFHPLGAPGSRPLCRFLADAGVPREERGRVPLVFAGNELLWAAGVRPCEGHRVRGSTRTRLRLRLDDSDARSA